MEGGLLATPRLGLRPFVAGDAELLAELDADPRVMRWINAGRAVARDEVLASSLPRVLAATDAARGIGFWTARERADGARIGWFHLKPPRIPAGMSEAAWNFEPGELEIGWRLVARVWGRGLAPEGAAALVEFALRDLRAPRVVACTMAGNTASRRVMEKLGMELDGEFAEDRWPLEDKRALRYALR